MTLGMIGYLGSDYIVRMRVNRSLKLFENRLLTGNQDLSAQIQDGLTDEFSRLERVGMGLFNGGFALLERGIRPIAQLGNQQRPALAAASPRIEDVTEKDLQEERVNRFQKK